MTYRKGDIADLPKVVTLVIRFFSELPENVGKKVEEGENLTLDGQPLSSEIWKTLLRFLTAPNCIAVIGEENGEAKVLFIAELVWCEWTATTFARDQLFYITPDARGCDWAGPGLSLVEEWLKNNQATHLMVTPTKSKNNTAFTELLTRRGFTNVGFVLRKDYAQ